MHYYSTIRAMLTLLVVNKIIIYNESLLVSVINWKFYTSQRRSALKQLEWLTTYTSQNIIKTKIMLIT